MKILVESGVVEARQEGKWTHYRLSETGCAKAAEILRLATTPRGETEESCRCAK
jgi:ArsR family transcriptional regulator